jgi:hypothetical protein
MPWNAGNPEPSLAAEDHASRPEERLGATSASMQTATGASASASKVATSRCLPPLPVAKSLYT